MFFQVKQNDSLLPENQRRVLHLKMFMMNKIEFNVKSNNDYIV